MLGIPGHAAVVPRDLISEQLLLHPAFVQMWAARVKGPAGAKILCLSQESAEEVVDT